MPLSVTLPGFQGHTRHLQTVLVRHAYAPRKPPSPYRLDQPRGTTEEQLAEKAEKADACLGDRVNLAHSEASTVETFIHMTTCSRHAVFNILPQHPFATSRWLAQGSPIPTTPYAS